MCLTNCVFNMRKNIGKLQVLVYLYINFYIMFVVVVLQMCFMCIRVMSISIEDSQQGRKFVLMSG